MKTILIAAIAALSAGAAFATEPEITRAGSQAASIGPAEFFTGTSVVEPLFDPNEDRSFGMAKVSFLPGARSNWHTHPVGQTLVVTSGTGWTQIEGQERQTINAGDVVWCPPGVKHWHGATDTTAMSHLAVHEFEGDSVVTWLEPVTDSQFLSQ